MVIICFALERKITSCTFRIVQTFASYIVDYYLCHAVFRTVLYPRSSATISTWNVSKNKILSSYCTYQECTVFTYNTTLSVAYFYAHFKVILFGTWNAKLAYVQWGTVTLKMRHCLMHFHIRKR